MGRGLLIAGVAMVAATFGTAAHAGEADGYGAGMCAFGQARLQSVMKTLSPAEQPATHEVAAAVPHEPVEDVEALLSSLLGTPFKLPETAEQDG